MNNEFLLLFIASFLWLEHTTLAAAINEGRIVGGQEANSGQFPFVVAIDVETQYSTYFCGGALISSQWILTAGHCVDGAITLTLNLGSNKLPSENDINRVTVTTNVTIIHPNFNIKTLENDVALIEIPEITLSENIQTLKLASIDLPIGILAPTALGWGSTSNSADALSTQLNYATLSVISNSDCRQIYGGQITDTMLCVQGEKNEGTCFGDSGSPLVVRPIGSWQLEHVGISAFFSGNGCENGDPSGYTRTYPYVDWIKSVIEQ